MASRWFRGSENFVSVIVRLSDPAAFAGELLWLGVTAHPTTEWIARQLTEACGWREPPRYIIRDRDDAYGSAFIRRLTAMGIRDRPVSALSAWQNGLAERLIGLIRRDCLDHIVIFGEQHLCHFLNFYQEYYNESRTHLLLLLFTLLSTDLGGAYILDVG